jgi:saccharopine dehydrogenase-like NADP-dependent oxidoreductase
MKVFALGAYGEVGLPAIKLLAQSDLVTEIAVVGRSLERAEKAAREIGEKGVAVPGDGTDERELVSLSEGYDIIMNAATHKAVLPSILAATRTGTHYCDVASFGDFVEQALRLSSEAEAAGTTAIVATGISPCISNLMGVHVARQLDEVEQLQIGRADIFSWETKRDLISRQGLEEPEESLSALRECRSFIVWMLRRLQENGIRTMIDYQDGQWVESDPIESGLDVPLAQGGRITLYPFFSGDDYWGMLPRDLSAASSVELWFTALPPQLHELLRERTLRMLEGDVDAEVAISSLYDAVESDPDRWLTHPDDFVLIPKMWARAVGRKESRAARHSCWFTPGMWNAGGYFLTSVALAVAVRKILRGEVQEKGVMHAEKAFEPLPFFDEVVALLSDPPQDGRLVDESFEWLE